MRARSAVRRRARGSTSSARRAARRAGSVSTRAPGHPARAGLDAAQRVVVGEQRLDRGAAHGGAQHRGHARQLRERRGAALEQSAPGQEVDVHQSAGAGLERRGAVVAGRALDARRGWRSVGELGPRRLRAGTTRARTRASRSARFALRAGDRTRAQQRQVLPGRGPRGLVALEAVEARSTSMPCWPDGRRRVSTAYAMPAPVIGREIGDQALAEPRGARRSPRCRPGRGRSGRGPSDR